MTRQQFGPVSGRKSLVDNQGRAQQATVGLLREDPLPERANVMAEYRRRDSRQPVKCRAGAPMAVYYWQWQCIEGDILAKNELDSSILSVYNDETTQHQSRDTL